MPEALRDDQIEDLAAFIAHERHANLNDPGTGKTPTMCVHTEYLYKHKGSKTIMAQPKSLLRKNKREFLRFTNFKPENVIIVDGTPKQRQLQMEDPRGIVWLMGFKRYADDWERMLRLHSDINYLLIDEFHMGGFKNPDSQRSKALEQSLRKIKYFVPMSGTLIAGRLDSCYTAIKAIEPRYYYDHNSFIVQHALKDEFGNILAWINHEKLGRIFIRHAVRRTFESVYGKQAIIPEMQRVPMDAKSLVAYEEFEEKAIVELEDSFLEGTNPGVHAMRCRQIMAHPHTFKILKPGELTGKDELLEIHVQDHLNAKTPVVIFAALIPEQERIAELCRKWGMRVGLINSTVSATNRSKIDEDFANGLLDCIVGSPATAAVGFNWNFVDHVIFVSLDYENVNASQAYKRMIRGKRTKPLRITFLAYENSVDQRVFQIVDKKNRDLAKVDGTYTEFSIANLK